MIHISRIAVLVATVALAAAACGSPAATGTPAAPPLAPASHAAPSAASSTGGDHRTVNGTDDRGDRRTN